MVPTIEKVMCWYHIWSLLLLPTGIKGGNCPAKCTNCQSDSLGNLIMATCKDVVIQGLPNTLQELHVSDASLMTIVQFKNFRAFVLANMVDMERLYIYSYGIQTLQDGSFQHLSKLQVLDLSKNAISQITENTFEGLSNLLYLSLQQNSLANLGDFIFRKLSNLEELHLGLNSLKEIGENHFKGLPMIKKIDLQNNKIGIIHEKAFQELSALEDINLQNNELVSLEAGIFTNLLNLKTLNLKMNNIQYIDANSIRVTSLTYLDLMQNNFTEIPTALLQVISNENLEVNLARNHITEIGQGELQGVLLKTLFLVGNNLSSVHPDALCDSFIQMLSLEQNMLSHLPEGLQRSINQSTTLSLGNNPWSCDCDIQWMKAFLKDNIQEPVCAEPLSYHGHKLSQILEDLKISCGGSGTLPVPSMNYPVPPRQQVVTPKLEKKTTICQTTVLTEMPPTQVDISKESGKGGNSNIGLIVGIVVGVVALAAIASIVVALKMKKTKVFPEYGVKCRKPDFNAKPRLKYFPQQNEYAV